MRRLAGMSTRTRVVGCAGLSVLLMASLVWAAQGRTLNVTMNYTGSGEVTATNAVYLSVWDTPNMAGGTIPIGQQVVTENGDVVAFENLTASTVYVAALYDDKGGWDGASVPPSGMPAGAYSTDPTGAPSAIEVGDGQTVDLEFSFSDAFRLP